jgi:hypothetical protein
MDEMGTPGPNHPARRGLTDKRTENQFENVLDLNASRIIKEKTGKSIPIHMHKHEASPEMDAHWHSVIRDKN